MQMNGAVWDILKIVHQSRHAGKVKYAGPRRAHRFNRGAPGIDHRHTIDTKAVFPNARRYGTYSNLPDVILAFRHRRATLEPLPHDFDAVGTSGSQSKRNFAIRVDFRGPHPCSPLPKN